MEDIKRKVIIDTDNGDDIDDLITLYFALNQDKVDIIGVVCSYLNAPLRMKQIEYTLKLFNRTDIPIYRGLSTPTNTIHPCPIDTVYCQYTDKLGKEDLSRDINEGVNFIIKSAKKYKSQLTILEIAPELTLAEAIRRDKEAFADTKIVLMGGCFYRTFGEWNIECDYTAAKDIISSGLDLTYVGLDVTEQTELKDQTVQNKLLRTYKDEKLNYLSECSNTWVKFSKRNIVLHDPLTFLTLIDDSLCEFELHHVELTTDGKNYFTTINDENKSLPIVKIAKTVDYERLINDHYNKLLKED